MRRCGHSLRWKLYYPRQWRASRSLLRRAIAAPASSTLAAADAARPGRLVSLDVFRGATIAAMILVNDPGSWSHIYPPLEHAEWNGWTPTDLIFPFFLFIVGVSLTLSFASRIARGLTRRALVIHVVRRSALIFAIGLLFLKRLSRLLISAPFFGSWGVLQRIALCYLVAGLLYLATFRREPAADRPTRVRANLRVTAAVAVALLVGYWALMMFVPVPGYGAGASLERKTTSALTSIALSWADYLWSESRDLGMRGISFHAARDRFFADRDYCRRYGCVPDQRAGRKVLLGLAAAGLVLLAAGQLLHPYFPINKNLWTSSFVLFTGGFAMLALAACYWIVDVRAWRSWTPHHS